MASPLDSTYGIWLVALFLETILYGCGLLQTWLYFHWYSKDHWGIKSMVIALVVFETLQITLFFASTYICLIDNFGNFPALLIINWEDSAQLMAGYLSAFIVQMYFAYCIYALDKKKLVAPLLIVTLALLEIGAAITQTVKTVQLGSFILLDSTKAITSLQSGAAVACDIVITFSLVNTLDNHKTGIKSTNSMLNMLMINAINRGMLTAVCAALNLILFLALPGQFYFFVGLLLSSKLYMNSALATLNTRQHILSKAYPADREWQSIPIGTISSGRTLDGSRSEATRVQVTVDSESYPDYDRKNTAGPKSTFIDGMM
ncbi:hypothetical protein BDQ12DRAFT_221129 [Crucibulum laeve]|uniref:DUF6534 domain-containing protein n=1 Tax=Crucibulum laeve TaxID=68775 RepID=A0A5C3LVQ2_9AGAR|nr:hypothetical protein BDQ12DRAFT_221129 [Crucibulum laeve]